MAEELSKELVDDLLEGTCPDCKKKELMQGERYSSYAILMCDSCKTRFQVNYFTVGHDGFFGKRGSRIWTGTRLAKMRHVDSVVDYLGVSK